MSSRFLAIGAAAVLALNSHSPSQKQSGFVSFDWDQKTGKIRMAIPAFDRELLYVVSLGSGLGSNPIGLDRGQLGSTHVVVFQRIGPKILLIARNLRFRAHSDNAEERQAVAESFTPSVLWGFEVAEESDGVVSVDATDFLLRDAHGVIEKLKRSDQGSYRLDKTRSAMHLPRCKAFPDNTEFEATLTFTTDKPGSLVRATAPTGRSITLREHHSFIRLPDTNYRPRRVDPRIGYFGVSFADYAQPIEQPLQQTWIQRHRLERKNPDAASGPVVEPIVYYLDRGIPEPVRTALHEGAMWWQKAFARAGFENAFRVEALPEGTDPQDVRYNIIHWVHRSTRGWSYGGSIHDPRTGEILKGNVLLGSLRVRQDHLIFEGLGEVDHCAAAASPSAAHLTASDREAAKQLALARIRQLSAHEVGHSLGLAHNFAASTYANRASVMDYPAPLVTVQKNGKLDFTKAYGVGTGAYDDWAIRYGYSQFPAGTDEATALEKIVRDGLQKGFRYITDTDARAVGTAHAYASLWDNGSDPSSMLREQFRVRAVGLRDFNTDVLLPGEPLAQLEQHLVPLYLHHRYQLAAAAKLIGGMDFAYSVKGDGQAGPRSIDSAAQRTALELICSTLEPEFLALPERIIDLLPPHPPSTQVGETFAGATGRTFDPLSLAATCASLTLDALLAPSRTARLQVQHARDPQLPDLQTVLTQILAVSWYAKRASAPHLQPIARATENVVLDRMMALSQNRNVLPVVRAIVLEELVNLRTKLTTTKYLLPVERAHRHTALADIEHFLARGERRGTRTPAKAVPPGSPIGAKR